MKPAPGEAKGICGSGLVDLVAVLLERGVIDESGRPLPPQDAPEDMRRYLTEDGQGNGVFHLTKAVSLTARDAREPARLAKAAVAGGIRVLKLEQRGVTADDIASVELAGGFGNYLSPENVVRIGMLPRACLSKIRPLGYLVYFVQLRIVKVNPFPPIDETSTYRNVRKSRGRQKACR